MKKYLPYIIFITALAVRLYGMFQPGLLGSDPYYHLAFLKDFMQNFDKHFPLSYAPSGIANSQPLGMYIILIPIAMISPIFSIKFTAAFIGALTVLTVYYFSKKKFSETFAFSASFFSAVTLAHIARTVSGNYRGEIFIPPIILLGLYVFDINDWKKVMSSAAIFGISAAFWLGYPYAYIVFAGTYFFAIMHKFAFEKISYQDSYIFLGALIVLRLISRITLMLGIIRLEHPAMKFYSVLYILPFGVAILSFLSNSMSKKTKKISAYVFVSAAIISAFAVQVFFPVVDVLQPSGFSEVGELMRTNFANLLGNYFIILLLSAAGAFFFFRGFLDKRNSERNSIIAAYIILSVFLLFAANRFTFLASIPIIFLASVFIEQISEKRRIATILIIVALQLSWSLYLIQNLEYMDETWRDSLEWIQATPEESLFMTWWDDASKIQYAGRATIADSVSGQVVPRIERIAKFYVTDTNDIFADLNLDYVLLSFEQLSDFNSMSKIINESYGSYQIMNFKSVDNGVFIFEGDSRIELYSTENPFALLYSSEGIFVMNRTIIYQNNTLKEYSYSSIPYVIPYVVSEGCFFLGDEGALLFSERVCNSNFAKLFFFENLTGFSLEYDNPFIKIYRVENIQ